MNNRWRNFLIFVLGVIAGMMFDIMADAIQQPNCPQEDSCHADYYDGSWHIIED